MANYQERLFIISKETKDTLVTLDENAREDATYEAGQQFLKLLDDGFRRMSRKALKDITITIARFAIHQATFEDIRAWVLTMEEVLSL